MWRNGTVTMEMNDIFINHKELRYGATNIIEIQGLIPHCEFSIILAELGLNIHAWFSVSIFNYLIFLMIIEIDY